MEFQEILRRRKMIRSFDRRPVPREVLLRVMESVLHAPSAGFTQGNEFLVIDTPEGIDTFLEVTDDPHNPYTHDDRAVFPPVIVLPLSSRDAYTARYSEPDKQGFGLEVAENWPAPYWDIDAGMASMLILLSAIEEGLGGWFFGLFAGIDPLLARFGVPASFAPIGAIGLGYPIVGGKEGSRATRRRRPASEVAHFGLW